jgi:hypothetical protein
MSETILNNAEVGTENIENEVQTGQTPPDTAAVVETANWRDALPEDLRGEESLKLVNDVNALAKSYVHAQKMMGADKIAVPSKHATPEDWKAVFNKIGLPSELDKYDVKLNENTALDEDFLNSFKEKAFNSNVLPHQAQEMMDWYNEKAAESVANQQKSYESAQEESIGSLRAEFGEAYDSKIQMANSTLIEIGGEELANKIIASNAANDPDVIRLLVKIGDAYGDDSLRGDAKEGQTGMSPADAETEIQRLMLDPIYHDKSHPGHVGMMNDMAKLFKAVSPE